MKSNIYNNKYVNTLQQPQFFGEKLNIARNDVVKYPRFEKLFQTQFSFFWNPEEIDLKQDSRDWKKMSSIEKRIFEKNLAYQTLLDSIQERSPSIALLPYTSLPELEQLLTIWPFFETIHNKSYQHIMRNVFANPTKVFDDVINDENIRARAESIVEIADDYINYAKLYDQYGEGHIQFIKDGVIVLDINIDMKTLYKKLYLYIVSVYFLESIRFYVSFVCSFYFAAQRNICKGNASIITMIARDEKLHTAITLTIIKNFKNGENNKLMLEVIEECKDDVMKLFHQTVDQEREWIKYLFADGPLLGLNEEILTQYLEHISGNRLKNLGFENIYKHVAHPCTWVESYFNPVSKTAAPQEMEVVEYLVGNITMDGYDIDKYKTKLSQLY